MKNYQKIGSALALVLGSTGIANAVVIHDSSSLPYEGAIALGDNAWAEGAFSTSGFCPSGCTLNQISLRMRTTDSLFNPVNVSLSIWSVKDVTSIANLSHTGGNIFPVSFATGLSAFTSSSPISLLANTTYWVRLTNQDSGKDLEWTYDNDGSFSFFDPTEAPGNQLSDIDGLSLKMKVEATPNAVPLPASAWLMGTALLGLVNSWRKRRS
jgi:hypothetical protein